MPIPNIKELKFSMFKLFKSQSKENINITNIVRFIDKLRNMPSVTGFKLFLNSLYL